MKRLKVLLQNSKSHTLDLSSLNLDQKSIKFIAECLEGNTQFQKLKIDGYQIGDNGAILIGSLLVRNACRLKTLSLAAGISGQSLQFIEAERKDIGSKGGEALGRALFTNTTLEDLNLQQNSIRSHGGNDVSFAIRSIGRALEINITLTSLNISGNRLSEPDIELSLIHI
eukprot:TRINITY_DN12663_c0_g1_i1.p1 TRINITY_DN12663_c0_g1~~TRINITY_DN12663_c0_g1_i1.p1  ORF type:complete len:170 (-),score=24.62 TRINITY_DN12663_c0_g1_i1:21-530(-)